MALKQHPAIWLTSLIVMLALTTAGVVGVMATAASEVSQRRTAAEGVCYMLEKPACLPATALVHSP